MTLTWKQKMVSMPMLAYTQNDLRAGSDDVAPMPNAMKFVMDVMVIATPAWDMVAPIRSMIGFDFSCSKMIVLYSPKFAFL